MKKKIIYSALLTIPFLTGCNQNNNSATPASIETVEQSTPVQQATSHTLAFDESITFNDTDYRTIGYPVTGLKMTVKKPIIDENIVLGKGYPDSEKIKFEGKRALVVTTEVENTTDDYIDLVGHTILDSEGKTLDFTFVDGVSTQSINGLTGKQKATIVMVYLASNDKPVTVTYANTTWKDDNKNSDKNLKSSSQKKNSKVAKSSSNQSTDSKDDIETQSTVLASATDVNNNTIATVEVATTYSSKQSSQVSIPAPTPPSSEIVDQHASLSIQPAGLNVYDEYYTPELEEQIAIHQQMQQNWSPNHGE